MSIEFERLVLEKLDFATEKLSKLDADVTELKEDVAMLKTDVTELKEDVAMLKTDVAELKEDVLVLKTQVSTLKKGLKEVKEDISILKNEVFNVIKPKLDSIKQNVDIMTNINTARILNNQIKNYKELGEKIDTYQKENELEHSRLNYEICKLKANA